MVTPWRLTRGNEHRDYSNLSHYFRNGLGAGQSSLLSWQSQKQALCQGKTTGQATWFNIVGTCHLAIQCLLR